MSYVFINSYKMRCCSVCTTFDCNCHTAKLHARIDPKFFRRNFVNGAPAEQKKPTNDGLINKPRTCGRDEARQ